MAAKERILRTQHATPTARPVPCHFPARNLSCMLKSRPSSNLDPRRDQPARVIAPSGVTLRTFSCNAKAKCESLLHGWLLWHHLFAELLSSLQILAMHFDILDFGPRQPVGGIDVHLL